MEREEEQSDTVDRLLNTNFPNLNQIIISILLLRLSHEVYPDYSTASHPSALPPHSGLTALISFLSIS